MQEHLQRPENKNLCAEQACASLTGMAYYVTVWCVPEGPPHAVQKLLSSVSMSWGGTGHGALSWLRPAVVHGAATTS